MNIKDYKIFPVLFSPGLGGNHLSNMLSTSPWISNRKLGIEDYNNFLIKLYNKSYVQFHAEEFLNFGVDDWAKAYNLVKNNSGVTVLPGHIEDGYWVLNKIRELGPIGAITFEVFDFDLNAFYKKPRNRQYTNYNPHIYRFMYTKEVVSRILDIPENDILAVNVARLHQSNIDQLLTEINNILNLDMDINLCKKLHDLWYARTNNL